MAAHDLPPSPVADPASYPGERPDADYLFSGDRIRPLTAAADGWRLGTAGGEPAGGLLDELLGGPLHLRHPVLAFGSNAAPAQLAAKFGAVTTGIPVTRARLRGFALGHSPHVSVPGYIPWVLIDEPGTMLDCVVLWLDRQQQARLDVTEPNYHLVTVDPVRYPLTVPATHAVIGYSAYRGRWGALRWPHDERPAAVASQAAVFARLGGFGWFRDLVGAGGLADAQRRLASDDALRDRVRDELAARGMTVPDGWTS